MPARAEDGLFGALETELRKAKQPMDCNDLYDKPSVREHALSVNRVSDYLGNMWRKGKVLRLPAPKDDSTRSRRVYVWKGLPPAPKPTLDQAVHYDPVKTLLSRPNLDISEEGDVITITLPHMSITIKAR